MVRKLPKKIARIVAETKFYLVGIYAQRLQEVILFGSYARGSHTKGSDIDLLLLFDKIEDPDRERERYLPIVSDLSLKYDTVVSVVPMDSATYRSGRTPLILNIQKEGVLV